MLIKEKIIQYCCSILLGLTISFDTAVPYFVPCLILIIFDVYSAHCLGRRLKKKYPKHADGKFKSQYINPILKRMILIFSALILASHIDVQMIGQTSKTAEHSVMWIFIWYQVWSILENWSSENNNKIATALQYIMVNKAERHLNVKLSDILLNKDFDGTQGNNKTA